MICAMKKMVHGQRVVRNSVFSWKFTAYTGSFKAMSSLAVEKPAKFCEILYYF